MSLSSSLPDVAACLAVRLFNNATTLDTANAAAYCAGDSNYCAGICPNTDLAGIGVRAAFYSQSVLNGLLVLFSPDDSAQGAWSATVLTASLIIPAMTQKYSGQLTLYHSILVLNFSTLSTLVSLAVAPRCTIWREGKVHHGTALPKDDLGRRGRVVLAIALLGQVILQWLWAAILFTSPWHAQPDCSGSTVLFLFGKRMSAEEIDDGHFAIWPCWLLFCLGVTLLYGIILVISSSSDVHPAPSSRNTPYGSLRPSGPASRVRSPSPSRTLVSLDPNLSLPRPNTSQLLSPHLNAWPPKPPPSAFRLLTFLASPFPRDRPHQYILLGNLLAFLLFLLFIITSEVQITSNCVLPGENTWSFGQTEAVLLAVSPLWALVVAFYKYPATRHLPPSARPPATTGAAAAAGTHIATSITPSPHHTSNNSISRHPLRPSSSFDDDQTSAPLGLIGRPPSPVAQPGSDLGTEFLRNGFDGQGRLQVPRWDGDEGRGRSRSSRGSR